MSYKQDRQENFGNDFLKLLHLNARSLTKNFDGIKSLISDIEIPFTCIMVSETWLNDFKLVPHLDGYNFVGMNRPNKIGGGVGIYVLGSLNYKHRDDLSFAKDSIEATFVELLCASSNIIIGSIYRAPNSSHEEFLEEMEITICKMQQEQKMIFMGGDLNINFFELGKNQACDKFLDMLLSSGLMPTISKTTRLSVECESLIDNILTNCDLKIQSGVFVDDRISDHFPIFNMIGKQEEQTGRKKKKQEEQTSLAH